MLSLPVFDESVFGFLNAESASDGLVALLLSGGGTIMLLPLESVLLPVLLLLLLPHAASMHEMAIKP
jgi:hypothetical protein